MAIEGAWTQWGALLTLPSRVRGRRFRSIVDPEALILMSLVVQENERRLADVLAAWAQQAARLLSVQRMRSLAVAYPEAARTRLAAFGELAAQGGDKRWKKKHFATSLPDSGGSARVKEVAPLRLLGGASLMVRLRAGFGVGAKADLLSFLLGLRGAPASLTLASFATAYTSRALRSAAEDMVLAGFIRNIVGPPTGFSQNRGHGAAFWNRMD